MMLVLGLFACKRGEPQHTSQTVVDSIFPVEEEIRRFKAVRNGATATRLTHASESRDALVKRFIAAIEASDSADLRAMTISAAEFIDLYYPSSIYAKPPYKQSPELFWFLLRQNSEKGIKRLLERYSGTSLNFRSYSCNEQPLIQAENRFWSECVVRWSPTRDAPNPMRIFGVIMEREGGFKFVSFANDL